jgi:type IV secretory pathway TrbL component
MDLRFDHAIELLGKLTKTVAEFARQESELSGVLSAKNYQEMRRHREAVHKVDTALAAQIAEADASAEKKNEYVQAIHDRRLGRVKRAHGLLMRTLPKRAQDAKGNWLGELQMRQLRAERSHVAGNKQNEADYSAL